LTGWARRAPAGRVPAEQLDEVSRRDERVGDGAIGGQAERGRDDAVLFRDEGGTGQRAGRVERRQPEKRRLVVGAGDPEEDVAGMSPVVMPGHEPTVPGTIHRRNTNVCGDPEVIAIN
jgi:hypothetical protein